MLRVCISLHSPTALSTGPVISVQLLNDPRSILDDLGITVGNLLSERVNDVANPHLLELLSALLVHAQVADGEESDSSRGLRGALVIGHNFQELFQGAMSDQVLAQGVRVAYKVS